MFRKPVERATQGDRVALCVTDLRAKLIERGLLAAPGTTSLITSAIVRVRRVRFFRGTVQSKSKFHITVGHTTVMGSALFFGGGAGAGAGKASPAAGDEAPSGIRAAQAFATARVGDDGWQGGAAMAEPHFDWDASCVPFFVACRANANRTRTPFLRRLSLTHLAPRYEFLEALEKKVGGPGGGGAQGGRGAGKGTVGAGRGRGKGGGGAGGGPPEAWALLQFEQPLVIQNDADTMLIGSKLDADAHANACRIAFHGRLAAVTTDADLPRLRVCVAQGASQSAEAAQPHSACSVGALDRLETFPAHVCALGRSRRYKSKFRSGVVERIKGSKDGQRVSAQEVIGGKLFSKETLLEPFFGLRVEVCDQTSPNARQASPFHRFSSAPYATEPRPRTPHAA